MPVVPVFSEPEEKGSNEYFPDQAGTYHSLKSNRMEWIIALIIVVVLVIIWLAQ